MCLAFKEQTSKVIFRFIVPFANRLANLRLADWLANLQIGQICRFFGTYLSPWRHSLNFQSNLRAEGTFFKARKMSICG